MNYEERTFWRGWRYGLATGVVVVGVLWLFDVARWLAQCV